MFDWPKLQKPSSVRCCIENWNIKKRMLNNIILRIFSTLDIIIKKEIGCNKHEFINLNLM